MAEQKRADEQSRAANAETDPAAKRALFEERLRQYREEHPDE